MAARVRKARKNTGSAISCRDDDRDLQIQPDALRGRGQPPKWVRPVTRSIRLGEAYWERVDQWRAEHGLTLPEAIAAAIESLR